jgi:hypothetical protein
MASRSTAAMIVMTLIAAGVVSGQGHSASASVRAQPALELMGSPTRTVRLVGGRGSTAIIVRNRFTRPGRLRLVFLWNRGERIFTLTGESSRASAGPIAVRDPDTLARPLAPGEVRRVALRLVLPSAQAPTDVSGRLEVSLAEIDAPPLAVSLDGAPADIVFDPARITIDVSQGCWLVGGTCGDTQTVLVRGRDALAWARTAREKLSTAILNNEHGGSLIVKLRNPRVEDGVVHVDVDASDLNEAGHYAGPLPLDPTGVVGPALNVDVNVRWSLATAVLTIFLGALTGGFFLRRFEIQRRRRLLELELRSALHRYDEERARSGPRPASYDLDYLLEPRRHDEAETLPYPGTRGVSALLWHIRTARDDADFSEDLERSHALIAQIERWLKLEPVVRETAALLEDNPPPRDRREFSDCGCYRDLGSLRMLAASPPSDDAECEWLVRTLAEQGRVTAKCKVLWELLGRLESRTGWSVEQATLLDELDVVALERRWPRFKERTPEQTAELRAALIDAEYRLRRLSRDVQDLVAPSPLVAQALRIEEQLEATERNPAITRAMPDVVLWRLRLTSAFNQVALRSLLWTLARALVAAAAYALIIYSDTWGSITNFASAFTAGFLTETIVNWAVLPAFRSVRQRRAAPPGAVIPSSRPEPQVGPRALPIEPSRPVTPEQPPIVSKL